jgi:O-acetylhomoserine (thiol)-lyase
MKSAERRLATIAVHGSHHPDQTGAMLPPIYQTTAYAFEDADHAARLFNLEESGNIYTRINNPTNDAFEQKIAALEGGVGALATASGQAATMLALLNLCTSGQHIVAANTLYGGSYSLLANTFAKMGISVTFVDPEAPIETIERAFRPETRAIFAETIGNPGLNLLDFDKFSALSTTFGVPLVVDNTFATPVLCRPLELGAHIVVHSATKYLGGHGNSMGGVIVDGGRFTWDPQKFPGLTEPDASYHGIRYVSSFGSAAYIVKARVQLLRDLGPTLSPFNAFLISQGMETLPLRIKKQCENALGLARHLEEHPDVSWVCYPGLPGHPSHEAAAKWLADGMGGMLTFGVRGGAGASKTFIDSVELATHVTNLGDNRTLVSHPASTTHRQLSEKEQLASGVLPDLIRVSTGIEDLRDLLDDIDRALAIATAEGA